jgi:hypothetical protein
MARTLLVDDEPNVPRSLKRDDGSVLLEDD